MNTIRIFKVNDLFLFSLNGLQDMELKRKFNIAKITVKSECVDKNE